MGKKAHKIFKVILIPVLIVWVLCFALDADCNAAPAGKSRHSLEKDLQHGLQKSGRLIKKIKHDLRAGADGADEIAELLALADEISAMHALLDERFRLREDFVAPLGARARERHLLMSEGFGKALAEYMGLVEELRQGTADTLSVIEALESLLDGVLHKKRLPIYGSLPYRNLNYPTMAPASDISITPAFKGGNQAPTDDDLASTPEAPVSEEIAMFAQSLGWDPVRIYEWVKNNVETEWYRGCMKGAEETLRQKSGNDCDQSALLVALLRASGFPTRYVRGTIEFFPGIEKVKNLTGIEDPWKIAELFRKAGVPFEPVISGGKVSNFRVEHIWVESLIPYSNYRGALMDEHGKTWLGLDTSIKAGDYVYGGAEDLYGTYDFSAIKDEYLGARQTATPLEYIRSDVSSFINQSQPGLTYDDVLFTRSLPQEVMNILPASLQFKVINVTNEYTAIPDDLMHRVRFTAADMAGNVIFDKMLLASGLSGRSIAISFEPETVEDQETVNSFGGLGNTPAYLVRLRPVLTVDSERVVVGTDGLPMGADFTLAVELVSPGGTQEETNTLIAGNLTVVGVACGKAMVPDAVPDSERDAERLLHERAMDYMDRWGRAEDELATLMHLVTARPVPSVVTLGGVVDVTYLLEAPHGMDWKGVYMDADLRAVEAVPASANAGQTRLRDFMRLSALQGSVLEGRVFEDGFQVESISTAKLMGIAREGGVPVLTIDRSNAASVVPGLPFDGAIKDDILNAVNGGNVVTVPGEEITYEDWTGTGYIKEDPDTGEAGCMLSGMIAGGMTAWGADRWPEYYFDRLADPFSKPPNYDPFSASYINKIALTDVTGTVGKKLPSPLQVMVTDKAGNPVVKAEVTFTVLAGGGSLTDGTRNASSMTVETDGSGFASVSLVLGTKTRDNPASWWDDGYTYTQQVGENIVDARLARTDAAISEPFTAYGFPDESTKQMVKKHGDGQTGAILSFVGFVSVSVEDEHGNPFSNEPVKFVSGAPVDNSSCANPNQDTRPAMLIKADDACVKNAPIWGECGSSTLDKVVTDSHGAAAQVILGGVPEAEYPITAISGGMNAEFTLKTYPFGNCDGESGPTSRLFVQYIYPNDSAGNNINAGKVGTKVPVMARLFNLREGEKEIEETLSCDGSTKTCTGIVGSRSYSVETDLGSPSMSFAGVAGIPQGGGVYAGSYTLSAEPGLNEVTIEGSASVDVRRSVNSCSSCSIVDSIEPLGSSATMQVYSVDVRLDPLPVVLVDEAGRARKDYTMTYTIEPPEYQARSAQVLLFKGTETIAAIRSETGGQGSATIARGFALDPEAEYSVQVVLNNGTGVEMRSERLALPVASIRVMNDADPDEAGEIRFGDGSWENKRYRVELKSWALTESCDGLTGTLRVIDRDFLPVTPPDAEGEFYPTSYPLGFSLVDGKCVVKLTETVMENGTPTEKSKGKFIVTNLSRIALDERILELKAVYNITVNLDDYGVFYGGLGNIVEVEINGANKGVPIEPVGIIVLAIDGLRQDVLYPEALDKVKDPHGNYRVDLKELHGIGQILKGHQLAEENQRYIMLPEVTAIFPSITLASWASIFTGEMPGETGIMGNEFFARDIYDGTAPAVPGMEDLPKGMVTLSSGAFKNDSRGFLTENLLPVHEVDETVNGKVANSSPNGALRSPQTIYEWMREHEGLAKYYDSSGNCMNGGCRSAVIYNHYARGTDWWGTMDKYTWNTIWKAIQGYFGNHVAVAELLDETPTSEAKKLFDAFEAGGALKFPALTVVYYAGLDHFAHHEGMDTKAGGYEGYSGYLMKKTDAEIEALVTRLKKLGEFDNKIFIVVADHGHTAMPTDLTLEEKDENGNVIKTWIADSSCELKITGFNNKKNQFPELANNNLHIWELAEMMRAIGERGWGQYSVLAPKDIASLYKTPYGATDSLNKANVIAALDGPMAHLYFKDGDWSNKVLDINELATLAGRLKNVLKDNGLGLKKKDKKSFERLLVSVDKILIRDGGEYKLYKGLILDNTGHIIKPDVEEINFASDTYVDALTRVEGLNNTDRSGDIVLIFKDLTNDTAENRFTSGVSCKSWHGSLNRSDSYVPFIFSYPGGNKKEIEPIISGTCSQGACEGNWNLYEVIKEIIQQQFADN